MKKSFKVKKFAIIASIVASCTIVVCGSFATSFLTGKDYCVNDAEAAKDEAPNLNFENLNFELIDKLNLPSSTDADRAREDACVGNFNELMNLINKFEENLNNFEQVNNFLELKNTLNELNNKLNNIDLTLITGLKKTFSCFSEKLNEQNSLSYDDKKQLLSLINDKNGLKHALSEIKKAYTSVKTISEQVKEEMKIFYFQDVNLDDRPSDLDNKPSKPGDVLKQENVADNYLHIAVSRESDRAGNEDKNKPDFVSLSFPSYAFDEIFKLNCVETKPDKYNINQYPGLTFELVNKENNEVLFKNKIFKSEVSPGVFIYLTSGDFKKSEDGKGIESLKEYVLKICNYDNCLFTKTIKLNEFERPTLKYQKNVLKRQLSNSNKYLKEICSKLSK